jgi:hypothetical protein
MGCLRVHARPVAGGEFQMLTVASCAARRSFSCIEWPQDDEVSTIIGFDADLFF